MMKIECDAVDIASMKIARDDAIAATATALSERDTAVASLVQIVTERDRLRNVRAELVSSKLALSLKLAAFEAHSNNCMRVCVCLQINVILLLSSLEQFTRTRILRTTRCAITCVCVCVCVCMRVCACVRPSLLTLCVCVCVCMCVDHRKCFSS